MTGVFSDWRFWAVGSAVFAAATALLAKVGVEGVNSNFATFVRTLVILPTLFIFLLLTRQMQHPGTITPKPTCS